MIRRARFLCALSLAACVAETPGEPASVETDTEAARFAAVERRGYAENALYGFADAERAYRETSLIARDRFAGDPAAQAEQTVHLALNKSNIGEYQLAEALFARSRPFLEAQGSPAMSVKPALFYAQHLMNLGRPAEALGDAREAAARATRALEGAGDAGAAEDPAAPRVRSFEISEKDSALLRTSGARATSAVAGVVLTEREKLFVLRAHARYVAAKALDALRQAGGAELLEQASADIDEAPNATVIWLRAAILLARADVAEAADDLPRAIAFTSEAVERSRQFAANQRPEALARLALARRLAAAGRGADAVAEYRRAIDVLSQGGQGVRYEAIAPYVALLADAANRGDAGAQADVFTALQQVRSPVTAQTLAQVTARLTAGDGETAGAIRAFQDAQRNVNRFAARIDLLESAETVDVHSLNIARDQFREAQAAAATAESALESAAPNYDQLVDSSASLGDVQNALRDGAVFVQIALGEREGAVALIDPSGLAIHEIPIGTTGARDLVDRIRAGVDGGPGRFDLAASKAAFDALFGPVREQVLAAESLVVTPSGPLLSLPLALLTPDAADANALWTAAGGSYDYRSVRWLGVERPITTAVSASSFAQLDAAPGSNASTLFRGYGDFVEYGPGPADEIVQRRGLAPECVALYRAIGRIGALPSTAEELTVAAEELGVGPGALVTGRAFTDQAVMDADIGDVRILHLATHGLLPLDVECLPEPALVTSLASGAGDALLDAGEIADLRLDADLVVLSACDTGGQGALTGAGTGFRYSAGGEALSGLVRAFFFAGARNVVASHWSVSDVATQILMVNFYRALGEGETLSEALRQARAALASSQIGSHPYFWAAFSAIGDGSRRLNERRGAPGVAEESPGR